MKLVKVKEIFLKTRGKLDLKSYDIDSQNGVIVTAFKYNF